MKKDLMPYRPQGDGAPPVVARLWALPPDHRPIPSRPDGRWKFSRFFSPAGFRSWLTILVPAPIRAQIIGGLPSGGCASKQAAHRLLSTAHPGENRVDSIKEPNSIPYLWRLVLR